MEPPLAIDQESKSSDEEDDGWNETYVLTDEETLEDVGHKLGIDPEELQRHNGGVAGCNPRTGLVPIDAPMSGGTEIWVPTSNIDPEPFGEKATTEKEPSGSENEDEGAPDESAWKGQLRTRRRDKALTLSYGDIPKLEKAPTAKEAIGIIGQGQRTLRT